MTPWDYLPNELVLKIFSHLDIIFLADVASRVCRRWEALSKSPYLWEDMVIPAGLTGKGFIFFQIQSIYADSCIRFTYFQKIYVLLRSGGQSGLPAERSPGQQLFSSLANLIMHFYSIFSKCSRNYRECDIIAASCYQTT